MPVSLVFLSDLDEQFPIPYIRIITRCIELQFVVPPAATPDIMEEVGFDPDRFHISMHTEAYNHVKGTQKTATTVIPDATADFHVFRVDWTPEDIRGFIDDKLIFTFVNEHKTAAEWPFDKRFHWLLNVAVGGNWGGQKGVDDSSFPAAMQVDYVRVYRLKQ